MGFGSGGGGFTPSPNNVPGSTRTGTSLTDTHEFTGSVDITGSLTLNGSSVTGGGGGGGGAVSNYTNAGDDRVLTSVNSNTINGEASLTFDGTSLTSPQVTASVSMKAATLEVSSSAEGALFRVDHSTQAGAKPIIFVTGSGLVGIGTDSPREDGVPTNRLHILAEDGADQGQDPVVNTALMLENNNHVGIQFMFPNGRAGQLTWGTNLDNRKATHYYASDNNRYTWEGRHAGGPIGYGDSRVMTMLAGGDSVNLGQIDSGHMITNKASLHISSSTGGTDEGGPVLLRVDHADQPGAAPSLFVTGSGRVGVGTAAPSTILHISSSDSTDAFRIDTTDTTDNPALFVAGATSLVGIGCADPEARFEVREDVDNEDVFIQVRGDGSGTGYAGLRVKRNIGSADFKLKNDSTTPRLEISTDRVNPFGRPNVELQPGGEAVLKARYQAGVEITGSTKVSGTFGSTTIETLTSAGAISATTGLTIIDASSSLAVDSTLSFTIADGTFAGQEKKIRAMIISGSTSQLSTGVAIGGANIDSMPPSPAGQIVLSGNLPGKGPVFNRAGCTLVWNGTKWLPVGNFNFNINNTGRSFI